MSAKLRVLHSLLLALALASFGSSAFAWVSISVNADNVTIEVAEDGTALVTHELLLRLRGGPLRTFTINGVDADAVAVGDATITRAASGRAAGPPTLLVPQFDGEAVHLELSTKKGVGSGSYLVHLAYRTNLQARGAIQPVGDFAEVSWRGPMFDDGIGSLQTTFAFPPSHRPPHLPDSELDQPTSIVATDDGVFLAELQRTADFDRLQLSRPHVPKHERVLWRARVDARVFSSLPLSAVEPPSSVAGPPARTTSAAVPVHSAPWLAVALALASLLVTGLVALKRKLAATSFVLRLRPWLHYACLFGALAASLWAALGVESATLAGVGLVVAMLMMLQQSERPLLPPKGPGRWRALDLEELELPPSPGVVRGLWLDASSGRGLFVFSVLLVGFAIVGLRLLGTSPYHSAMTLVYSTLLVPLFFTVGSLHHRSLLEEQQAFLLRLKKRLDKRGKIRAEAYGRYAQDAEQPDELRLRLNWDGPLAGLHSFEVGLGFLDATLKRLLVPAIVVRVRDGSPAHHALPRDADWSRGRDVDERIAVVRPVLPLLASSLDAVRGLVERLHQDNLGKERRGRQSRRPSSKSAKSAGSGSSRSKLGSSVEPAHASR